MSQAFSPRWPLVENLPESPPATKTVWVWSFSTGPGPHLEALEKLLDNTEAQRANRLRSARAQAEFVNGRGLLRLALGKMLGRDPRSLGFSSTGNGKPILGPGQGPGTIHFNLGHSHGMGVLAIATHAEVGVDIERLREISEWKSLARRYFHPEEVAHLDGLADDQDRLEAFFHAWTRKEAFLKATGAGIGFGLDRVRVTLGKAAPARLLHLDNDAQAAGTWTLCHLDPEAGWMAALALKAPCEKLVTGHVDLADTTAQPR